jgi:predicted transcriptional regulator
MQSTSIPVGLPSKLFLPKNREIEKAALFFLAIKSLQFRDNGFIKNYKSRIKEIGTMLDCSEATVRRRIGELKAIGLVSFHGKSIALRSYQKFCDTFQIKNNRRFYIDFSEFIKNPRAILECMALSININQQKHVINKKLLQIFGQSHRRTNSTGRIAAQKIKQATELTGYSIFDSIEQVNLNVRTEATFSEILNETKSINQVKSKAAISCVGMAKMIGRQSGSTGSKRLRKMSAIGMIDRKYRYEVLYVGEDSGKAISFLREINPGKIILKRGKYVISPVACSIEFNDEHLIRFSSCKVNAHFARK